MNAETITSVAQKLQEVTGNSLNMPLDFFRFKVQVPALSDEDLADTLLYLEQKSLIKADNKHSYQGATLRLSQN